MNHILMKVRPRKIAWIVKENEWDIIEDIIDINCKVIGGYYNIMICLNNKLELSKSDKSFLESYDPDIIVLSQGIDKNSLKIDNINPFKIIEWSQKFENIYSSHEGICSDENIRVTQHIQNKEKHYLDNSIIAAAIKDNIYNKLALVACGDVKNEEIYECEVYNRVEKEMGYRRNFLKNLIKNKELIETKDLSREDLYNQLSPENRFPLYNPVEIINMCISLQEPCSYKNTFSNLTKTYHKLQRFYDREDQIVLLISEEFKVREATMFWNLRASERYVSWSTFNELNQNKEELKTYLRDLLTYNHNYKDLIEKLMLDRNNLELKEKLRSLLDFQSNNLDSIDKTMLKGKKLILSSERKNKGKIEYLMKELNKDIEEDIVSIKYYDEFTEFDFKVPYLEKFNALYIANKVKLECKSAHEYTGSYIIELEFSNKKFPYNKGIEKYISDNDIRIGKNHNILVDAWDRLDEVEIKDVSLKVIFDEIFKVGEYGKIVISSAGKYQKEYIKLAGNFENAIKYLTKEPYKKILNNLSRDKNQKGSGWWIQSLNRYVYNIIELYSLLGIEKPNNFTDLYRMIDKVPEEIIELHNKSILERGFLLSCKECGYKNWYAIKDVGEEFTCSRCSNKQVYQPFQLECIKLKEVVVQGMISNMDVPLLAINYLNKISKKSFEWIYDSDFIKSERNLDILCSIDGNIYIGEAKSLDDIENQQFDYYENLITNTKIDGIIFATSKNKWGKHTMNRIEKLRENFKGDIIILTGKELYE